MILKSLMDFLKIEKAHMVGLSMGGYIALMLGLAAPERCLSVVCASGGSGAYPETRQQFLTDTNAVADKMLQANSVDAAGISSGPSRVQLQNTSHRQRIRSSFHHLHHLCQPRI